MLLLLFLTALLIIVYAYFIDNFILASIAFIILIFTCLLFYFKFNYNNIESFTTSSSALIPYDMFYSNSSVELQNLATHSLQSTLISATPSISLNLGIFIYLPNTPVLIGQTISVSIYLNIDDNISGTFVGFNMDLYYNSSILTYISYSYCLFSDSIITPVASTSTSSNNLDRTFKLQTDNMFGISRGASILYRLTFLVNSDAKFGIQNALSGNLRNFNGNPLPSANGSVAKVADFTTNPVTGFTNIGQLLVYTNSDIIAQEDGSSLMHALQENTGAYIYLPQSTVYPGQPINIQIYANTGVRALGSIAVIMVINTSLLIYDYNLAESTRVSPFGLVFFVQSITDGPFASSLKLVITCENVTKVVAGSNAPILTFQLTVAPEAPAGVSGAVTGTVLGFFDGNGNGYEYDYVVSCPVADCYSTPSTGFSQYLLNGVNVGRLKLLAMNQSEVGAYIYIPNGPVYPGQPINIQIYANTGTKELASFQLKIVINTSLLVYNPAAAVVSQFAQVHIDQSSFTSGLQLVIECHNPSQVVKGSNTLLLTLPLTVAPAAPAGVSGAVTGTVLAFYDGNTNLYASNVSCPVADCYSTPLTGFSQYSFNVGRINVLSNSLVQSGVVAQWSYPIAIGLDESRLATYTSTDSATQSGGGTSAPSNPATPSLPINSSDSAFISAISENQNTPSSTSESTTSTSNNSSNVNIIVVPSVLGGFFIILFIVYFIKKHRSNRVSQYLS
jgi:hypothetical protein